MRVGAEQTAQATKAREEYEQSVREKKAAAVAAAGIPLARIAARRGANRDQRAIWPARR